MGCPGPAHRQAWPPPTLGLSEVSLRGQPFVAPGALTPPARWADVTGPELVSLDGTPRRGLTRLAT